MLTPDRGSQYAFAFQGGIYLSRAWVVGERSSRGDDQLIS
jgi:hypothetical protein